MRAISRRGPAGIPGITRISSPCRPSVFSPRDWRRRAGGWCKERPYATGVSAAIVLISVWVKLWPRRACGHISITDLPPVSRVTPRRYGVPFMSQSELRPGLEDVPVAKSAVSFIDGHKARLEYRGKIGSAHV